MIRGAIFVFLGACSFGILSTFVKMAYAEGYTVGQVTGIQAFLGFTILWLIHFVQTKLIPQRNAIKNISKPTPAWKVVASGLTTGSVSILYYKSVQLIPASLAIILLMQFVWLSIVLEAIIFKKRPTRMQLLAVVIVLAGTLFASGTFSSDITNVSTTGIILGFLAALAYSLFILLNGRIGNDLPPIKKSALMLTGACALIFIIFPPTFLFNGMLTTSLTKWGIILALFGTVIPPLFYAIGVPKAGVTLSSILSSVELPVAVCMSYFILKEPVDVLRWIGVAIILCAIVLPNLKTNKI